MRYIQMLGRYLCTGHLKRAPDDRVPQCPNVLWHRKLLQPRPCLRTETGPTTAQVGVDHVKNRLRDGNNICRTIWKIRNDDPVLRKVRETDAGRHTCGWTKL
jgi:hypothetical protein